jgi:hypothetical protein
MAGIRPVLESGPLSFSANVNISGGQMVEPDSSKPGFIKPATVNTVHCLGVAISDAAGLPAPNQSSTDAWGNPTYLAQVPPNEVAVAYEGVWRIVADGAIAFGDWVAVGAAGAVKTADPATADPFTIVGLCVDPAGIATGVRGKIRLGGLGGS